MLTIEDRSPHVAWTVAPRCPACQSVLDGESLNAELDKLAKDFGIDIR